MLLTQTSDLESYQSESIHLFGVVHAATASELSQQYLRIWAEHNSTNNVIYPLSLNLKTCDQCGVLLVPGLNVTIRIRFKKKRTLQVRCRNCRHMIIDESVCQRNLTMESVTLSAGNKGGVSNITTSTTTSKAKQRAKRRKGGLGALLEQKKQETQQHGLDLMEFMK